ncbi:MAG: cyclic nucleotide-binding and patatin-like phospholipase domain-containing protein [Chloroflexota bacterium]
MTDIQQTLVQIVNRVVHIRLTLNRAVDTLLERDTPAGGYTLPALSVYDMERYIEHWRFLIPPEPESKARIIHQIIDDFAFSPGAFPQMAAALELDSDAVKSAYQQAFDEDLASRYTDNIPAEEIADTEAAQDVLTELQWQYLKRGEVLFTQGEDGDYLYSVVDGRLRSVLALPNGQSVTLEFHSGEVVGEQALITEIPYTATVTALRDSDLVRMHRDGFERLVQKYPRGMMQLAYQLMTRSQKVTGLTPTAPQPQSVAILPVTAGTDDFPQRLVATFQSYQQRESVVLAPDELEEKMPPEMHLNLESLVDDYIFVDWLQAMQNDIDILLLVGDRAYPNWTRRAIEQADHILIVGRAGEPFDFAPWKAIFDNMAHPELTAERELVMLHETQNSGPYGTRDWLRQTDNVRHHHVALDSDAGFERVVRFILGKAVGFVFGGGGMRGASHLGVIQALNEAGIHADVVGGTSAGSIVAAQYAAGWSVPDMLQRTKDDLLRRDVLFNLTLPYVAMNTGTKSPMCTGSGSTKP